MFAMATQNHRRHCRIELAGSSARGTTATGNSNRTFTVPVDGQTGDLVVVCVHTRNAYGNLPTGGPEPWSELDHWDNHNGTLDQDDDSNERIYVHTKYYGSDEPASWNVYHTDDGTNGMIIHCTVWRGGVIPQMGDFLMEAISSNPHDTPNITSYSDSALMCYHGTALDTSGSGTVTVPTGFSQVRKNYQGTVDIGGCTGAMRVEEDAVTADHQWTSGWGAWAFTSSFSIDSAGK